MKKSTLLNLTFSFLAGIALISLLSLQSFKTSRYADEIWKQLGMTKQDGDNGISNSFMQGYLDYYSAKNIKNIALGNRSATVLELGNYSKQFVNSASFKKLYQQNREERKPQAPAAAKTIEQVRTEQIESLEKSLKEMQEMLKMDNADLKEAAKEGMVFLEKQLADYKDPKSQMIKLIADGEKFTYDNNVKNYQEDLLKWEANFPADPNVMIKARLQHFLEVTDGIDYNAALKEQYGKKRFVNPAFESKNAAWKQGFRAGKEATETARSFAQQWLKELK